MIAPLREIDKPKPTGGLAHARRYVASVFFTEAESRPRPAPLAPWKAWLWAGWASLAAAGYVLHWLGWW